MRERKTAVKKKYDFLAILVFCFLVLYVISLVALYFWSFGTSLKTPSQFSKDILGWPNDLPWNWAWYNYTDAISLIEDEVVLPHYRGPVYFDTMLFNSALYTIGGTLVNNLTTWLIAYLITRFSKYKFSKIMYTLNIALMTIPIIGNLPSALAIFNALGWYDSYWFIVFNNLGFTGMYLLYYCAFIGGLGNEYYEAAYIDGAGNWTCMLKIAFPLTMQMFTVIFLLGAITRWNDYMTMLIWMPNYPTLSYGIYKACTTTVTRLSFLPTQMAICFVLMIPMLILFFLFQDAIMGNLRLGAIKG